MRGCRAPMCTSQSSVATGFPDVLCKRMHVQAVLSRRIPDAPCPILPPVVDHIGVYRYRNRRGTLATCEPCKPSHGREAIAWLCRRCRARPGAAMRCASERCMGETNVIGSSPGLGIPRRVSGPGTQQLTAGPRASVG